MALPSHRNRRESVLEPPYEPTVPGMLAHIASHHGEREAAVRGNARLTFGALERRSAELARGLLAEGVGKGSHVALLMPNTPDFVVAFMAAARIGAVVLPMSTLYQAPELRWVLNHADIDTLLVYDRYLGHDYIGRLEAAFPELGPRTNKRLFLQEAPYLRRIFVWGDASVPWAHRGAETLCAAAAAAPVIDDGFLAAVERSVTPADHLCMIYTSGSTADPKGVVHYHGGMMRHSWQMSHDYYPFWPGDRLVAARPWFWIAGLSSSLLFTLQTGVCLIVPESEDAAEAEALIERERANLFGTSPAYFARINAHLTATGSDHAVFQMSAGIAALARRHAATGDYRFVNEGLEELIPARRMPVPLDRVPSSFGQTETLATHSVERPPTQMPEGKEGASGRAIPGIERKIVDPVTGRELPPGEVGELYVRGYSLMAGLHKKERHEVFDPDGFYPSGDACFIDADDCLTFKARLGEMLKISGANVAPLEVERVLLSLKGVESCAVVGLPRDGRGTLLAAAVVPLPGVALGESDIIAGMKQVLSSFKVPKRVFFMEEAQMPRTATGKVRKFELVDILLDGMGDTGVSAAAE